MEFRRLGRSGLTVAPIVLGGNVFGWGADEPTSFKLLDAFLDAGFNAIDTANTYSRWVAGHKGGESETVIGNWFKASGKRARVLIATKIGEDMGYGRSLKAADIVKETEGCLARLQTDHVDLMQTHFDDDVTPVEETLGAYAQLIKQGKVRAIGASNLSPARLKESLAASERLGLPRYESLQPLYNLYDRERYEQDYEALCVAEGLGVITYWSLAAGFLTGKYRTLEDAAKSKTRGGRVKNYLDERGLAILKALDAVAARHAATPAQIALAWVMARRSITAPIVSATTPVQLAEILKAANLTLTAEDLAELDRASSPA